MSLPPCCLTGELREQWELNKAIEQELKAQKKADKNEHKLLLLGLYKIVCGVCMSVVERDWHT